MRNYIILLSTFLLLPLCAKAQDTNTIPTTQKSIFDEPILLQESVMVARAEPITVKEDTVVYSASALNASEDAMLSDLLQKIPGLSVDDNGNITLYGKDVKKLLVNGKEFFGGDIKTGLENLPANLVANIKAYERESDLQRLTGIDDGEQESVLDLTIKKNLLDGWRGTLDLGGGTQNRYFARGNANKIGTKDQLSIVGSVNNINSSAYQNNASRNILGSGASGDVNKWNAGFSMSKKINKLDLDAHITYNGTKRYTLYSTRAENMISSSSFTRSHGNTDALAHSVIANTKMEWKFSPRTNLILTPSFRYSSSNSIQDHYSNVYNEDPDVSDTLKSIVNRQDNDYHTINGNMNAALKAQLTQRFKKRGRSVGVWSELSYNKSASDQYYDYFTRYYKIKKNPDSTFVKNQYTDSDNNNKGVILSASYNEPVGKRFYLQFTYRADYRNQMSSRDLYSGEPRVLDKDLSSEGTYHYFSQTITPSVRFITKKLNLTVGANIKPQNSILEYMEDGQKKNVRSNTFNIAPNITLKYKKTKRESLSLTYRSWSSLPSLYNLLPVANGTNPMNVHYGNPDLKPAFTHLANFNYNYSNAAKKESFVTNLDFRLTENTASNCTEYNEETGGKVITPKNIEGNWQTSGSLSFNKTFLNCFSINNLTSAEYRKLSSYIYNSKLKESEVNTVNRTMIKERLSGIYRMGEFEFTVFGGGEYTAEKNALRPAMNRRPYSLNAGATALYVFPWKMRVNADFNFLSQKGTGYSELNRRYYLLNASISQPVLKKKATLRLEAFDLLGQQQNMIRSFTTETRSVSYYNGVGSYIMLHFIYRFNYR